MNKKKVWKIFWKLKWGELQDGLLTFIRGIGVALLLAAIILFGCFLFGSIGYFLNLHHLLHVELHTPLVWGLVSGGALYFGTLTSGFVIIYGIIMSIINFIEEFLWS